MTETQSKAAIVHNDEPTSTDRLDREKYARAFARLAESCETPLVVGLYGTWGVGKSSLMKLIGNNLDSNKARAVWFDPWMHQFDENPALALAHTIVDTLGDSWKREGKKLLAVITTAFGTWLLKSTTGLGADDIQEFGQQYEQERFQVRDTRVHLREHFENLVNKARGNNKRLVFFIDDLDRCLTEQVLKLLEALKLYLNLEGCVYFLGVDREALKKSIKHHYQDTEVGEVDYLEKIVQLPFDIPLIEPSCMDSFVGPLLPEELKSCKEMLVGCLGENPRQVKRFVNKLILYHQLAKPLEIKNYDPKVLSLLLLIQDINPELYFKIVQKQVDLEKFKKEEIAEVIKGISTINKKLSNAIIDTDIPDGETLKQYIYLTRAAVVKEAKSKKESRDLADVLEKHKLWLMSDGKEGERADLSGEYLFNLNLSGANLEKAYLVGASLKGASLKGASLEGANLEGANLKGANLKGANLEGVNLRGANLERAILGGANLRGANLERVNLRGANLRVANLVGASLGGAYLERAILRGANLEGTNLGGAILRGAILKGAILRGVDLGGASLEGASLIKANLTNASISNNQLKAAITDKTTVLPDGSRGPYKPGGKKIKTPPKLKLQR